MCMLVAFLFVAFAPSLMAQTAATGALTGTVSDATGAVAPNVTVTATNWSGENRNNRRRWNLQVWLAAAGHVSREI